MDKEQKRIGFISDEVSEQLSKWQDEDHDKRAVIVIAFEVKGDAAHMENFICGKGEKLIDAIYYTLSDHDKRNKLTSLMRRAVMMYSLEGVRDGLEHMMNSREETSDKEGN